MEQRSQLGKQILSKINKHYTEDDKFKYGSVVDVVHAGPATLAKLDFYSGFTALAYTTYRDQASELSLLKDAAYKLGYTLTKKRVKKA